MNERNMSLLSLAPADPYLDVHDGASGNHAFFFVGLGFNVLAYS
jgi:hypothetical protein